jgi:hypothetical protein
MPSVRVGLGAWFFISQPGPPGALGSCRPADTPLPCASSPVSLAICKKKIILFILLNNTNRFQLEDFSLMHYFMQTPLITSGNSTSRIYFVV